MSSQPPKDLERVSLYLRKSRADIESEARGEGETLSKHRRALMEFAQKHRLNIVAVREELVSGEKIADRPEMKRLLQEVETGQYDAVLCMDLDRLGRGDMIDQGNILAAFKGSQTYIITPRKVYDLNDELDEEWSEFESFMARRELKIITRRLQRGRVQAVKEGRYIGTTPPYGYDVDSDLILIPNKDAATVKMIFHLYTDGQGSTKIAQRLDELGIKSHTGNHWDPSVVRSILKNEVYIGRLQWRKSYRNKVAKICYIRPREDWIDVQGKHKPLIDEDTFQLAQKMLAGKTVVPSKLPTSNPLAGLIVCGKCGYRMVRKSSKSQGYDTSFIQCFHCDNKGTSFKVFEKKILEAINKQLEQQELDQAALENETQNVPQLPENITADLEAELSTLQKQKANIQKYFEQGVYDVKDYLERNRIVGQQIEETKKALTNIKAEREAIEERNRTRRELIPAARRALDIYHKLNNQAEKNILLKTLISKIVYTKDKAARLDDFQIEIHLQF
jgi:site-specific DNA recombinase